MPASAREASHELSLGAVRSSARRLYFLRMSAIRVLKSFSALLLLVAVVHEESLHKLALDLLVPPPVKRVVCWCYIIKKPKLFSADEMQVFTPGGGEQKR